MKGNTGGSGAGRGLVLLLSAAVGSAVLAAAGMAGAEVAPAATKKAVILSGDNVKAERVFAADCGRCHAAPDPAKQELKRPDCGRELSRDDIGVVRKYLADVHAGKDLYETRCGRCHDLIAPESRTAEYWSKNVCTSKECFVQNPSRDEEQQLLLYLSSHAGKK